MVQSQARRSTVLPPIRPPLSSSAAGDPAWPFKPSSVVVNVTCGRTPFFRGSRPSLNWWSSSSPRASAIRWP